MWTVVVQDEDLGWTVFSVFRSGLVPRSRQGQALNPTKLTCSSLAGNHGPVLITVSCFLVY